MRKYANKLYCFSPPVMLATFVFEVGAALFVLWRYKMTQVTRLTVALLMALGIFQLAEYMVCGGAGMGAAQWGRIGYVAIALLPPLGLHFVCHVGGIAKRRSLLWAYGTAGVFSAYFVFGPDVFAGQQCVGNYVIFSLSRLGGLFVAYYYAWLFWAMWLAAKAAKRARRPATALALRLFILGYAAFIVPTAAVNIVEPVTLRGLPSIMCGFAVFFAVILVCGVLPQVDKTKRKRNT